MRRVLALIISIMLLSAFCASAVEQQGMSWSVELEPISAFVVLPDGGIALVTGGEVLRLDAEGRQGWRWSASEEIRHIAADMGGNLYASYGHEVARLGADGRLAWRAETYGKSYVMAVLEGHLFVGWENGLFKYDLDGNLEWEYWRPEDC